MTPKVSNSSIYSNFPQIDKREYSSVTNSNYATPSIFINNTTVPHLEAENLRLQNYIDNLGRRAPEEDLMLLKELMEKHDYMKALLEKFEKEEREQRYNEDIMFRSESFDKETLKYDIEYIVKVGDNLHDIAEQELEKTLGRKPSPAEIDNHIASIVAANDLKSLIVYVDQNILVGKKPEPVVEQTTSETKNDDVFENFSNMNIEQEINNIFNNSKNNEEAIEEYITKLKNTMISKGIYCEDLEYEKTNLFSCKDTKAQKISLIGITERFQTRSQIKPTKGEISKDFSDIIIDQEGINNCWWLSTIGAISKTDSGQKALSNLITDINNKTISIKFESMEEPYVIPLEQVYASTEYSNSSLQVRALEIACARFMAENPDLPDIFKLKVGGENSFSEGGFHNIALSVMFGHYTFKNQLNLTQLEQAREYILKKDSVDIEPILNYLGVSLSRDNSVEYYHDPQNIKNALNEQKVVFICSAKGYFNQTGLEENKELNNNHKVSHYNHAMYVDKVQEEIINGKKETFIYVKDPHLDNGETVHKYTQEEFKKQFPFVFFSSPTEPSVLNIKNEFANKILTNFPAYIVNMEDKNLSESEKTEMTIKFYANILADATEEEDNFLRGLLEIIRKDTKLNNFIQKAIDESIDEAIYSIIKEEIGLSYKNIGGTAYSLHSYLYNFAKDLLKDESTYDLLKNAATFKDSKDYPWYKSLCHAAKTFHNSACVAGENIENALLTGNTAGKVAEELVKNWIGDCWYVDECAGFVTNTVASALGDVAGGYAIGQEAYEESYKFLKDCGIPNLIRKPASAVYGLGAGVWGAGANVLMDAGEKTYRFVNWADEKLDQAGDYIAETYQDVKEGVKEGAEWVADTAVDAYEGAVDLANDAGEYVEDLYNDAEKEVKKVVRNAEKELKKVRYNTKKVIKNAGKFIGKQCDGVANWVKGIF